MSSPGNAIASIVGVGETAVGHLERSGDSLRLEAAAAAIAEAGLDVHDIDGVVARQPRLNPVPNYSAFLSDRLGLRPAYVNDISLGGAAAASLVVNAAAAIAAGLCTTVLCVAGENSRSARGKPSHGKLASVGEDFTAPFGADKATVGYAFAARRHMHEFGTTSRQFGEVAVAARYHASLNPTATMRDPITVDDHQVSRVIADPLRLLDCCLVSDGAGAVIVTTPSRARDLRQDPVNIIGLGGATWWSQAGFAPSLTTTAASEASARAYRMAGIGPNDVDVAEIYDPFTSVVVVTLEDYGFCAKGEGGAFVEGGRIKLGGQIPVNTHGGLLSHSHVGGMLHITEAVTQLRGEAGDRQVAEAKVAAVSGECAETGIHVTLILGRHDR